MYKDSMHYLLHLMVSFSYFKILNASGAERGHVVYLSDWGVNFPPRWSSVMAWFM